MHGIQTNLMNFHKDTENWVNLYKKYFDSQKISGKLKKQDKRQKEKVFWRARETLALFTLFLILPKSNTGISFHGVVQNILILKD